MAWTAEDRRKYAPAIQEVLRRGMLVRLATAIDTIDPPAKVGRPRDWSTLAMLGALWHLARDGRVRRRLPVGPALPPHRSVRSRFLRWRPRAGLDRALAVLVACRRLAAGRKRRPTAAIVDTQSVRTGPQRGPRGYDAHKKVKGRKRVLMVDVGGDPLGVRVVPADVQDRDALAAPPRCASPGWTSASPRSAAASSSPATASSKSSSAPPAGGASWSSRGAGRSSGPSVACSATAACASTTRRAPPAHGT